MSQDDAFIVHMEWRCGVDDPLDDAPDEAIEPLFCRTTAWHYHVALCSRITEVLGAGDPLQLLLADSWIRRYFHLKAREL